MSKQISPVTTERLKRTLYDAYGGFSDKRIKRLERSQTFIIDDRGPGDYGANKYLFSYFCMVFADVLAGDKVRVAVRGNVPRATSTEAWARKHGVRFKKGAQASLMFDVGPTDFDKLEELADAMKSIVAPGAPRYAVSSYKYVCPRTAQSLKELHALLSKHWTNVGD